MAAASLILASAALIVSVANLIHARRAYHRTVNATRKES